MESVKHFLSDTWIWFITGIGLLVLRFAFGRVVKSYQDEIDKMNDKLDRLEQRVKKGEDSNFLPTVEANKVVESVQKEHEKMAHKSREDFKHVVNLIVDTNERIDKIFELLTSQRP